MKTHTPINLSSSCVTNERPFWKTNKIKREEKSKNNNKWEIWWTRTNNGFVWFEFKYRDKDRKCSEANSGEHTEIRFLYCPHRQYFKTWCLLFRFVAFQIKIHLARASERNNIVRLSSSRAFEFLIFFLLFSLVFWIEFWKHTQKIRNSVWINCFHLIYGMYNVCMSNMGYEIVNQIEWKRNEKTYHLLKIYIGENVVFILNYKQQQ